MNGKRHMRSLTVALAALVLVAGASRGQGQELKEDAADLLLATAGAEE